MASSASGIALAQIQFLRDTLHQLDQRHSGVLQALSDAQAAFARAKRDVDALSTEDETMHDSRVALQADIDVRQAAFDRAQREFAASRVRQILATFPLELLRLIFVDAVDTENELWPLEGHRRAKLTFDDDEALTPFSIACVNRRWRSLALATPYIWSCVTTSGYRDNGPFGLERVQTMLSRSKDRDLCLMASWGCSKWSTGHKNTLDALGKHTHRWRRATFNFPTGTPESALGFLHLPMGRLEDLTMWSTDQHVVDWSLPSKCSPIYPKLRRLHNNVLFTVPRQPLTCLVYLYMISDDHLPVEIFAVLRMARSLVELHIELLLSAGFSQHVPPPPLELPHLRNLGLYGQWDPPVAWLDSLQTPRLQKIRLQCNCLGSFGPMFDAVSQTVTSLEIESVCAKHRFLTARMDQVRKLQQLRRLTFTTCTYVGRDIPPVLASREAAGLPNLEEIAFRRPKLDDEHAHYLADLMQSLSTSNYTSSDATCSLSFVLKAAAPDVPEWLLEQHKFLSNSGSRTTLRDTKDPKDSMVEDY